MPLRDLVKLSKPPVPGPPREIQMGKLDRVAAAPPALDKDPLVGPVPSGAPMPGPIISFDGPDDDDNAALHGFRIAPPDSNGDVGPNHYVQFINLVFEMFDKTTGASVLGPSKGSALWIGFGGVCENNDDGDPIVLYDQFTDRWLMSQFEINSGTQCFAISQTGDPTGAYHRYAFDISPGANDYPKIGVWSDGYYAMFHEFNPSFVGTRVLAFEKDKMIQGLPAQFVKFVLAPPVGQTWFTVQPPHIEGLTGPPPASPAPFVMQYDDEGWGGSPTNPTSDFVKIWKFAVNWVTPASSTFTGPTNLAVPEYDINMCNFSRACIPQAAGGEFVDALSGFTMYRLVYRNFGSHQSVFTAETVDAGGDHAAIRWTEIRDPLGTPTVHQTGTHAPDALHRWLPSIAADKDGNVAIGYAVSSSTMNPSIRYAGRLASDPVGTLPQTEASLHEGTGVQTSGANRWGDYTSLSIDESDDCTFWYTNQYYQTSGSFDWDMRIGSFKFPTCTTGPAGTLTGTVVDATTTAPISGANVSVDGTHSTSTNASGVYSIVVPIGTYDVTASKFGYVPQTATGVVISTDTTTTRNFALTGSPAIVVDGFVTDGSGGGFPLYALVAVESTAGTENIYTDPQTGYYSFNAFGSTPYTFTVTAQIPGYNVEMRAITTGAVDQQENFALTVAGACSAGGYGIVGFTTDFTGGIPAGWTVTNNTINCAAGPTWNTSNFGGRANLTGGAGTFAIADSDGCGSSVSYDSNLVSPPIDMTGATQGLSLSFNSDYNAACSPDSPDFDYVAPEYSINGGATWTPFQVFCGAGITASRRGPRVESFNTMTANGVPAAKIRFRYKGGWDWWWEVDNVTVSRGCNFDGGGLVYGNVYDENTGLPINGATVTLDSGQVATTAATPNDPNVDDGFFVIYVSSPDVHTLTVSQTNYGTVMRNVVATPSGSQEQNFELPAGLLAVNSFAMRKRLAIGASGDSTFTLENNGGLSLDWSFLEINVAPPPSNRPSGPFQVPNIPFTQNTKADYYSSIARNAAGIPTAPAPNGPIWPNAGEFVNSFTTTHVHPWGAGHDFKSRFYVSNIGIGGGDDKDHEYTLDGVLTGNSISTVSAGGIWAADMTFNNVTRMLWQVNVGGDNCIFEMDPSTLTVTGNKICPAFGTSMRGLAFDPSTGNYYAGTWNGYFITEFTGTGSIVRTVSVGLPVSGLAFNALTRHLFVQTNQFTQRGYVLDANSPTLAQLGNFIIQNSSGGNAFGQYSGAGLEMDCRGNLWAVNQVDKNVYIVNTGETGPCPSAIPWLSEDPASGTIAPNGSDESVWTFTSIGELPGCREAQVLIINDTPYGRPVITAGLTVQFNDVPDGSFADRFIHGIAGAGISSGCGAGNFCPGGVMTRRQMAVWLLRGKLGRFYNPPPAVGIFADVPPESSLASWVEDLYNRGITAGCATSPLRYCPEDGVSRAAMALFLLKAKEGSSYAPPACTGIFSDMPCPGFFTDFAEELYDRGITAGCATSPLRYCPSAITMRSQMSVFEARTFDIPQCSQ
ncbi:MAG TPA: carboxypeptidase regulatory-like domain-containing protein [Thermoanaerobaculia bacterium]|nr:carboxypeptidase regulatory-like domain-containing protein [Thermoanaerobaculia bacterium]